VDTDREEERQRVDFIVQLVLSDEGFINYTMKDHAKRNVHLSNLPYNCILAVTQFFFCPFNSLAYNDGTSYLNNRGWQDIKEGIIQIFA